MEHEQLVHDLENLMGEVDVGWQSGFTGHRFGQGGCLAVEMSRMIQREENSVYDPAWLPRKQAMMVALGFRTPNEMFLWNDAQTHPDAIKARIKDALEKLG